MSSTQLSHLSDADLLAAIARLVRRERRTTLNVLLHLNEMDRRRLYLKLGFGSLFSYCTRHLKYSASAADRRIQTARCIRRFPEVCDLLARNEVNLSTIAIVARILTDANRTDILRRIRKRSQREVEAIAAEYRPPARYCDRVRTVCVRVPVAGESSSNRAMARSQDSLACEKSSYSRNGSASGKGSALHNGSVSRNDGASEPHSGSASELSHAGHDASAVDSTTASIARDTRAERKLLIQFLADPTFMAKYEEVCALLSNRLRAGASFEDVFGIVMEEFLERHSPGRRAERRKRSGVRTGAKVQPAAANTGAVQGGGSSAVAGRSRYVPVTVRDKVFARDGGRCTYTGANGKRCESTHKLHVDHIRPFARGGSTTMSNLRLLCARHNNLAAEQWYGAEAMRPFRRRE